MRPRVGGLITAVARRRQDGEGIANRNEVYLRVDRDVRQPFRKTLDLDQEPADIWAEAERLLSDCSAAYQPVQ